MPPLPKSFHSSPNHSSHQSSKPNHSSHSSRFNGESSSLLANGSSTCQPVDESNKPSFANTFAPILDKPNKDNKNTNKYKIFLFISHG